jgi:hypothetical protein
MQKLEAVCYLQSQNITVSKLAVMLQDGLDSVLSKGKGHLMTCICKHRGEVEVQLLHIHNLVLEGVCKLWQCLGLSSPPEM